MKVDEKILSDLETNALALRKIANVVLAGIERLRTIPAKPQSAKKENLKDREAEIIRKLITRNRRKNAKVSNKTAAHSKPPGVA